MDDKGWTKYYRAAHEAGTDLAYPSETLVRLFRGNYIKGMPKIYQGMSVLDVGCGSGNNMLFLASLGMRVSGVETSDEMCAAARGKLAAFGFEADVQVGDNRNLPFSSNSFHFLVSWNVLHYEDEEVRVEDAIAEYARVLKPGARLLLSTTGPANKILQNCKTLGNHRYQLCRTDDFRKGTVQFLFDAENYVRFYFERHLSEVEVGRVQDQLFAETLDWFIVTGVKPAIS